MLPTAMAKRPTEQQQQTNADRRRTLNRLSAREREVMLLIVEGLSNKDIARQLNTSESTVKGHLHSIYRRLTINNRTTLAVLVAQQRD
jgi:RNA polymerase sigma factor (sigma-70 family)